jgi:hypothetical protein
MPPFFNEVLGELEPHHQLPDLRSGQRELPLLGFGPGFQPPAPVVQEHPLPALQFVRGNLALPGHRIECFPAGQPQDQLRLALDAPPLRDLWALAGRRSPGFPLSSVL